MVDIHTHLFFSQFDVDRNEVIQRAFASGIQLMISVSTSPQDHALAIKMSQYDNRIYTACGLHPHYFNDLLDEGSSKIASDAELQIIPEACESYLIRAKEQFAVHLQAMKNLIQAEKKVIAVGECGLDYYSHTGEVISVTYKDFQQHGFREQIRLAQTLELPMIIHCRPSVGTQDAYEDLFSILKEQSDESTCIIMHCYMGDVEITKKLLTLPGVYFSFTGNITYPVKKLLDGTKDDIRETVKTVPLSRILMETDCPFLAPVMHRGKRNEPSFVMAVKEQILTLHTVSQESLYSAMRESIKHIFSIEI